MSAYLCVGKVIMFIIEFVPTVAINETSDHVK